MTELQFRQGDVLLVAVSGIPESAIPVTRDPRRGAILQEGLVTGHAHRIPGPGAQVFEALPARYLRVVEACELVHDEHDAIPLPVGDYQIVIHHEFVPGELPRQVED